MENVGIYALQFNDSLIYIGQSVDLERRKKEHLRKLEQEVHVNYKVQQAYNKYGEPAFIVIELCQPSQLNDLEIRWIKEFDSVKNGLNILDGGEVLGGRQLAQKYTDEEIMEVFELLCDPLALSLEDVMHKTSMPYGNIGNIARGQSHKAWLYEKYPEKYLQMQELNDVRFSIDHSHKTTSDALGIIYPIIVSPEGVVYRVSNATKFAKEHNLRVNQLGMVLRGKRSNHLGWSLKNKEEKYVRSRVYGKLIDPSGNIHIVDESIAGFARLHDLNNVSIGRVLMGKQVQHKGWKLYHGS